MRSSGPRDSRDTLALRDVREAERLTRYVGQIWERKAYAWYVATSTLRGRQMDSFLGNLWHLINPALQIGVYFLVFGVVLKTDRGLDNFLGYLSVGIFTFGYMQRSIVGAGKALLTHRGLIQMVAFPRALLPITRVLTETLASLPAYVVMFGVALATGESPKLTWLLIPPLLVCQALFASGCSLIASRAISHIPDIQNVLPFVFRLLFYGSGVIFNVNSYVEDGKARLLFELNPIYCFIETYRAFVLDGRYLNLKLVIIAGGWTLIGTIAGLVWFRAAEDSYGAT